MGSNKNQTVFEAAQNESDLAMVRISMYGIPLLYFSP